MATIRSMTAFASVRNKTEIGVFNIDLKSINSRYFEVFFKLPDNLRHLESTFRELLNKAISRGKFECCISFESSEQNSLSINMEFLNTLQSQIAILQDKIPNLSTSAIDVLNFPGVIGHNSNYQEQIDDEILKSFREVLTLLEQNKSQEGARLSSFIEDKLNKIEELLLIIKDNLSNLVKQEREKLLEKINNLKINVDKDRFELEVAFLAQKSDIAEEYERLLSHINTVREILASGGLCGKRLDFMMQEFNREANTMASKASNLEITKVAVELKVLIEQMREQIQNIE